VRYIAFSKSNPGNNIEFDLNFAVEETQEKQNIFFSKDITIKDIYPNPVIENAYVDYHLLSERVKAKIVVHNILGNSVAEYALPSGQNIVRIKIDDVSPGIYFYTLYLNDESVFTRKMMIRK
jgi:Secretion system C-terminal sorting domain